MPFTQNEQLLVAVLNNFSSLTNLKQGSLYMTPQIMGYIYTTNSHLKMLLTLVIILTVFS